MAEFEALKNRSSSAVEAANAYKIGVGGVNKFHAKITEADGIRFHSKKEARVFRELQARQHNGELKYFLCQVPFMLKGINERGSRTKHFLDFMAVRTDGQIEYIEVKGMDHAVGKLKRQEIEAIYGIKIQVV
jgi:predicted nucleic acid-binding Zn finger protein